MDVLFVEGGDFSIRFAVHSNPLFAALFLGGTCEPARAQLSVFEGNPVHPGYEIHVCKAEGRKGPSFDKVSTVMYGSKICLPVFSS